MDPKETDRRLAALREQLERRRQLGQLAARKKELKEAMDAGEDAIRTAGQILEGLSSAQGWGTWDLVGGGMISGIAKHSALSDAQRQADHLQAQLRKFQTELADVAIQSDIRVEVGGFLKFADFFFDGIIFDMTVLSRIDRSREQVCQVRGQVQSVVASLGQQLTQAGQEEEACRRRLEELVESAGLPE